MAVVVVAASAFALAACTGPSAPAPSAPAPSDAPSTAAGGPNAGSLKIRPADAVGTVAAVDAGTDSLMVTFTADAGSEAYDGAILDVNIGAGSINGVGEVVDVSQLTVGAHIQIWVTQCAEGSPMQCGVDHVELVQ